MSKLVLIDGHSILNRAFYGVPLMTNPKGMHINAIYGFLNIMLKILDEEKPDFLCVAFDRKEKTFRHEMYEAYKGTRKPMPEELHEQVPVMKEILNAMHITICEKPGLEADDILGTLAKKAEADGIDVSLISGDRDLLQIATDKIKIRIPKTKGNKTEVEDYYAKDVIAKYQVDPITFIDMKALMGDSSDNIPGVPKIGEKTAAKLLVDYGSLDGVYEHLDEITQKSIHDSLAQNRELADLSKALATIKIDAELPISYKDAEFGNIFTKEAYDYFVANSFKKYLDRFESSSFAQNAKEIEVTWIDDLSECETLFSRLETSKNVSFVLEQENGEIVSLSLSDGQSTYIVAVSGFITEAYIADKIISLSNKNDLCCFDVKRIYHLIGNENVGKIFDLLLAAYLVNPLKNDYTIGDIASEYLGIHIPEAKEILGKMSLSEAVFMDRDNFARYAGYRSYVLSKTRDKIYEALKEKEMIDLYENIEYPLAEVLYDMEKQGITVDRQELKAYGESLVGRINELEDLIYDLAGEKFNINSPKQLGEILFEKMGLPGGKKTKSGYSTAADVLEKLAEEYPIVNNILEYRGLVKLKSTYADGLADTIKSDGKIHTTFNQTITATGRISSTEPNLQNIPMRMELGRKIRKCFIPKKGYVFLDADYSQIELRLLAHMADDKDLLEAYRSEADIHRITASKVFHVPFEEVTDLQRRNAKAVNFGIVYGISSFGLSQDLSISRKEAKQYIEDYFETYKGIKTYLDNCVNTAKENGYVTTLYKRRRPIPELASSNFMTRSFGERVAMNSPIQGTAADIMKIAMINVYNALKNNNLDAKIIVQVHDELLIEVSEKDLEAARTVLYEEMKNAAKLNVNLEVDIHDGKDWYEAK
ncbi:MAG: DNA polymerase I [Lachnospiraceae bacterium]|nr:DNA polymerase I [Lachnospiraceae bacterium]